MSNSSRLSSVSSSLLPLRAVIALGANLGKREESLELALREMSATVGVLKKSSKVHQTPALVLPEYDGPPVADYLNMVVEVETSLKPEQLLVALHDIEKRIGRDRSKETGRWQSRTIDLDIVFYGDLIFESEALQIPHPQMHLRDFVLKPLTEIAPQWIHPQFGKTVIELCQSLEGK